MNTTRFTHPVCDLHAHSNFSDGTLSPRELVELAASLGIKALALTDHNTITGLPDFLGEADKGVELIPGIEFSTSWGAVELHIIALGVSEEDYPRINALVEDMKKRKQRATDELISALIAAGYNISPERIAEGIKGQINRAHIATELERCGYVKSRSEAFETLLAKDGGYYHEAERISAFDVIREIREMGAVSVLAHPLFNISEEELIAFLTEACPLGLDAMEVLYSEYSEEVIKRSSEIADKFGLLPSGGSDFHGENKKDISLVIGKGGLDIPYSVWERLSERLKSNKRRKEK